MLKQLCSQSKDQHRSKYPRTCTRCKNFELENYAEAFTALQSGQGDAMTTDNAILLGLQMKTLTIL